MGERGHPGSERLCQRIRDAVVSFDRRVQSVQVVFTPDLKSEALFIHPNFTFTLADEYKAVINSKFISNMRPNDEEIEDEQAEEENKIINEVLFEVSSFKGNANASFTYRSIRYGIFA